MRVITLLTIAATLAACTKMEQYYPDASKTVVDGETFVVRLLKPGTYQAIPNEPGKYGLIGHPDATVWARNVRAIEQVSGCKVVPGAVKNDELISVAATSC